MKYFYTLLVNCEFMESNIFYDEYEEDYCKVFLSCFNSNRIENENIDIDDKGNYIITFESCDLLSSNEIEEIFDDCDMTFVKDKIYIYVESKVLENNTTQTDKLIDSLKSKYIIGKCDLENIPKELLDNKEVIEICINKNCLAILDYTSFWKNDKVMILKLINTKPDIIKSVNPRMLEDKEIMIMALKKKPSLKYLIPESLQNDEIIQHIINPPKIEQESLF